jgi:hypothetical protein
MRGGGKKERGNSKVKGGGVGVKKGVRIEERRREIVGGERGEDMDK